MASATHLITEEESGAHPVMDAMVVRFAGDSGDGMQLTGGQFTLSTALAGNDLATFPDFPAEIRAPQGTTFGVSAFQINFGSTAIETAGDQPDVLIAMNLAALNAGHAYGETIEIGGQVHKHHIDAAPSEPGLYRTVTGAESLSLGLIAGAQLAELPMFFGGYPITPASAILHHLSRLKEYGITTFQAEDEIAAICAAIGASYAGQLGVTSSSGPGIALKGEAMGLAIMTELPLIIVNSQRGGPSTGLPTKTEQSDLYQAVYGRNGDAPMPVIAARSPADAFDCAIEAVRIATRYMTPVMLLTDGYIANAAEPWKVPDMSGYAPFPVKFAEGSAMEPDNDQVMPFQRNGDLARPWIRPGTPGLEHRIGGIEKQPGTGNIDYSPEAHAEMTRLRAAKVAGVADSIPDQEVCIGNSSGKLVVVGWGSTFGPIHQAVRRARARGLDVSHIHIRHIAPMPKNMSVLLKGYEHILVPEMNSGQLKTVLRDQFLVDARPINKVSGQPFRIAEIEAAIDETLKFTKTA